jgi:hypothetical protein
MSGRLEELLTELEELSVRALEEANRGDIVAALETVCQRGEAVSSLQTALAKESPVSYTEWNRLAVIHFQGNRIQESIETTRLHLAGELIQNVRDQALLGCVSGVVNESPSTSGLNETA